MAQVVDPSMREALGSTPILKKKKKKVIVQERNSPGHATFRTTTLWPGAQDSGQSYFPAPSTTGYSLGSRWQSVCLSWAHL
jgi:hypothetical protein